MTLLRSSRGRGACPFVAACAASLLLAGFVLCPPPATAQSYAFGGKVGTTGPGVEFSYSSALLPKYGLRANLNFGTYSRSHTVSSVRYRGTAEFRSLMLLADAHPFPNGFRLSAGLMFNDNRIAAVGRPTGTTITINDVIYPADAVDNVNGEIFFEPLSPYFGLGWGAAPAGRAGLFFSFDFGVIYQRPDIRLNALCGPSLPAAECTRLQSDLTAQEAKFRRDLFEGRMYPILTFGAGYRF